MFENLVILLVGCAMLYFILKNVFGYDILNLLP
jgi:hypothetical protein